MSQRTPISEGILIADNGVAYFTLARVMQHFKDASGDWDAAVAAALRDADTVRQQEHADGVAGRHGVVRDALAHLRSRSAAA